MWCKMANKIFERKGIKPSAIYDTYWKFAYERQNIFYARINNLTPWTNDKVLSTYKFTNTYRASDSLEDGTVNMLNLERDLSGKYVLISNKFW